MAIILGNKKISGGMSLQNSETIEVNGNQLTAIGTQAKSGQLLCNWVGTKEEYEAGMLDGSISEDWICWVTDDTPAPSADLKRDLFDVEQKDHILSYEESFGYAQLGTYVYKTAKLNEYYGYPTFYEKCLEEYNNSVEDPNFSKINVNFIGSPSQDGFIFSNFSANNYLQIPYTFTNLGTSWEYFTKFKLTSNTEISPIISTSTEFQGFSLRVNALKRLELYLSSNGTSWNVSNGKVGSTDLQIGVDYWIKIQCYKVANINYYRVYISTNGDSYSEEMYSSTTGTTTVYEPTTLYNIGRDYASNYLRGSIDLEQTYLTISENIVWNCSKKFVKKHPNGHLFYDINDKHAVDELYNTTGIAWFYGIDEANERIFLPRNDYLTSYIANGEHAVRGNGMTLGMTDGTEDYGIGSTSDRGASFKSTAYGTIVGTSFSTPTAVSKTLGLTADVSKSGIVADVANTQNGMYSYMVVGSTISDTSWVDVVTQVDEGVKDIEAVKDTSIAQISNLTSDFNNTYNNSLASIQSKTSSSLSEIETAKNEAIADIEASGGGGGFEGVDYTAGVSVSKPTSSAPFTAPTGGLLSIYASTSDATTTGYPVINGIQLSEFGAGLAGYGQSYEFLLSEGDVFYYTKISNALAYFYPFKGVN